ncbi:hypothetical protein [Nannocystis punicea]|uniref:Uncharacterized protein n=1 Tax=Nannocystis punicea TaxID=2995304 RepID=A0ABY7GXM1_9BACT|nr:hypothetical protein [Nannocystis poenicansa]WAS91722.1 hypothetical protein O0S08_36535 [Nannocystis poenicansa]
MRKEAKFSDSAHARMEDRDGLLVELRAIDGRTFRDDCSRSFDSQEHAP